MTLNVGRDNVGRMAERIVSNELEFRGFRVSDLNKEGTSANADLLAVKDGRTLQVQVKGATEEAGYWFGYGHCNQQIIDRELPMFNRSRMFYTAQLVVLVSVKTPSQYKCLILPTNVAEEAAQFNLDYAFRIPRADGIKKLPGKMWIWLDGIPQFRNSEKLPLYKAEQELLKPYLEKWDVADDLLGSKPFTPSESPSN